MESKELILRCKSKNGSFVLNQLTTNSTIHDLKVHVGHVLDVDDGFQIKLISGFPPKRIDTSTEEKKLGEIPLKSGDTLIIEEETRGGIRRTPNKIPVAAVAPMQQQQQNQPQQQQQQPQQQQQQQQQQLNEPQLLAILPEGELLQYIMPANNSCLFASIYFAASDEKKTLSNYSHLREIIADAVSSDPVTYSEAFLGKPNHEYCKWILQEEHWGGAIEISILCKHFGLEIVTVDMQSLNLHHFGENYDYENRIFLIYNGVHYDVIALKPSDPTLPLQTIFPITNEVVLQKAKELTIEAKMKREKQKQLRETIETEKPNYICSSCEQTFYTQAEVAGHARSTEHVNYRQA